MRARESIWRAGQPAPWPVLLLAASLLAGCVGGAPMAQPSGAGTSPAPGASDPIPHSQPLPSPGASAGQPSAIRSATPTPVAFGTGSASPTATTAAATWRATGWLTKERAYATATLLRDGTVLVAGGDMDGTASAELYDPVAGRWRLTGRMHATTRASHTATLLPDGRVLVAGGESEGGTGGPLATAELYDPATGRWTATGAMRAARDGHTAALLPDGRVLVAGGIDLERMLRESLPLAALATAELYDPGTGAWSLTGSMAVGRTGHTATLLADGRVLVVGGDMDGAASAETYDPASGSWTATGRMTDGRRRHAATLLPDGRVLVTGGMVGSDDIADPACAGTPSACAAELYDPGTGRWTATGSLHAERVGHTATLLPDGTVLVVGIGTASSPSNDVPAEIYDPRTGEWIVTASPARTRGLTATLLADGRVLVTGGFYDNGRVAELYSPGARP